MISLEPGAKVPVFNLDVAGTRTFFVGTRDMLVHDNTLPAPQAQAFDALKPETLPVQLTREMAR